MYYPDDFFVNVDYKYIYIYTYIKVVDIYLYMTVSSMSRPNTLTSLLPSSLRLLVGTYISCYYYNTI